MEPAAPEPPTARDSAHAIVLSEPFPDLVVEVDHLPGVAPSETSLRALVEVLRAYTLKQDIVLLPPEEIEAGAVSRGGDEWDVAEVRAAHEATFGSDRPWTLGNGTRAYLHVLYLDSFLRMETDGKTKVASGVAMRNVIVVFRGGDASGALVPNLATTLERETPVLLHEAGHAMGLIGLGAPEVRPHAQPDDPHHSRNPESVMHAAVDSLGYARATWHQTTASPVDLFDADDRADLAALRAEQTARSR
jgi:hypothetical protein